MIKLSKFIIEQITLGSDHFMARDLRDHVLRKITLTGKQRMIIYQLGEHVYAAKHLNSYWRLVTGTNFKASSTLSDLKRQVDEELD